MGRTKLSLVLEDFEAETKRAVRLTQSLNYARGVRRGRFTQTQYEMVVELAYLRGYLAWESFLEQSFLLYMLGKSAPSGFLPQRYALPMNRQHAWEIAKGDQRYPDWTAADKVVARANRFMKDGEPFALALRSMQSDLQDMKTIRNSIAHQSQETNDPFRLVVRKVLGYYPAGMTVGGFLDTPHPVTAPQITLLEHYLALLLQTARLITPK